MKKHLTLIAATLLTVFSGFGQGLFNNQQAPVSSAAPDGYGYTWAYDTSLYEWVNIELIGTKVTGLTDDNFAGPFDMGMNFQFYWETKSQLYIGSNGYLAFSPINIASGADGFPNTPISTDANGFIAPFMCDLKLDGLGNPSKVYYYHDVAENRFIVSFINVAFWVDAAIGDYAGSNSFQVILNGNDSSIVFNYQSQSGSWDPSYNSRPFPMVVGIENPTGQYGISISPSETGGSYKPKSKDCLIFRQPATALVTVKDAGPVSVQNDANEGIFMVAQRETTDPDHIPMYDLKARIGNFGNAALYDQITVIASIADSNGFAYVTDTLRIDSMQRGDVQEFTFPSVYTPQYIETTPSYHFNYTVQTQMSTDVNADNDAVTIELVALDTTGGIAYMDYVSSDPNNIESLAGSWSGGEGNSGVGIKIEPFAYPVTLTTIEVAPLVVNGATSTDPIAYFLEVWSANSDGQLDTLMLRDTVLLTEVTAQQDPVSLWTPHELTTPITVDSNGFFIAYIQQRSDLAVAAESEGPISRRTYEILDGSWASYRDRENDDFWMRAVVDVSNVVNVATDKAPAVANLTLAPNPARDQVTLSFETKQQDNVMIRIVNIQGSKVFQIFADNVTAFNQTISTAGIPAGIYFVEVVSAQGVTTQKLVIE